MGLFWQCTKRGRRPRYDLLRDDNWWSPTIGYIRMASPKRKKWEVVLISGNGREMLCHLKRLDAESAKAVAKVLLHGNG